MNSGRTAWLLVLCESTGLCQAIGAGVKIGVPATPYFETGASGSLHGGADYSAATRRYMLGASFEWWLSKSLGFEADALYRRMGYTATVNFFNSANGSFSRSAIDVKGNSWEFPILVKYRFGRGVRPYVGGGGVIRHLGPVRGRGVETTGDPFFSSTSALDTTEPSELRKRFYPGVTVADGIELGLRRVRVMPEFRYTRWTANISGANGVLRFDPNQVEFVVGVAF